MSALNRSSIVGAVVLGTLLVAGVPAADEESRAWKWATQDGSRAALEVYLWRHPTGKHLQEARARLAPQVLKQMEGAGTALELMGYVRGARRYKLDPAILGYGEQKLLAMKGVEPVSDSVLMFVRDSLLRASPTSSLDSLWQSCERTASGAEDRRTTVGTSRDGRNKLVVSRMNRAVIVHKTGSLETLLLGRPLLGAPLIDIDGEGVVTDFVLFDPTREPQSRPLGFLEVRMYRDSTGGATDVYGLVDGKWYSIPWDE